MKRLLVFSKISLALCLLLTAGCDLVGGGEASESTALLRYRNFSHYEETRTVQVGDTVLTTSTTSRVNIIVDGDTTFTSVPVTRETGYLELEAGVPLNLEVRSVPESELWADAQMSLSEGASYTMYTFGYGDDIQPVLIREESSEETDPDEQPPLSGEATFRFLHGIAEVGPVDIYVNRPAEADSPSPEVSELNPVFSDVPYLGLTDPVTREVSLEPESEMGNQFRIRITPANDTTVVFDGTPGFQPASIQYLTPYDRDARADDDSLNVLMPSTAGEVTKADL